MYKIAMGERAVYSEAPNYIRRTEAGCFALTDHDHADGVAVNGEPYVLVGHEMEGAVGEAVIQEIDGARMLTDGLSVVEDAVVLLERVAISDGKITENDVDESLRERVTGKTEDDDNWTTEKPSQEAKQWQT